MGRASAVSRNAEHQRASRIRKALTEKRRVPVADKQWLDAYSASLRKPKIDPVSTMTRQSVSQAPHRARRAAPPADEAPPSLTELAKETVSADEIEGGTCPSCSAPVVDGAAFCTSCGANAKPDECTKCHARLDGAAFCQRCGRAREKPRPAQAPQPAPPPEPTNPGGGAAGAAAKIEPLIEPPSGGDWDAETIDWFADTCDMCLMALGMDLLSAKERARINKHAAPMANKYLRGTGKYAVEFNFFGSLLVVALPRAWVKYVVVAEREAEARESADKKKREAIDMKPVAPAGGTT